MATTDVVFVFIFLPVSLLTLAFKADLQKYILLLLSLFFYACGSPKYFVLLAGMLVLNVGLAYMIENTKEKRCSFFILLAGIGLNTGVLFYYKYMDFVTAGFNQVFGTTVAARDLLLPMGISFFTFKAISLLIDVYKGGYSCIKEKSDMCRPLFVVFWSDSFRSNLQI